MIPYPCGVGQNCSMEGFEITCNPTYNPPRAFLSGEGYEVVNISIDQNQLYIRKSLSRTLAHIEELNETQPQMFFNDLRYTAFALSDKTRFTIIGCNSKGEIVLGTETENSFACASFCLRRVTQFPSSN